MKSQVNTRVFVALIVVVVVIVFVVAYRQFANNPAGGSAISAQQAGLGKPVYPHIPGAAAASPSGGATR